MLKIKFLLIYVTGHMCYGLSVIYIFNILAVRSLLMPCWEISDSGPGAVLILIPYWIYWLYELWILHFTLVTLHIIHCSLYTVHYTLFDAQCKMCTVSSVLKYKNCILHSAHCKLHTANCRVRICVLMGESVDWQRPPDSSYTAERSAHISWHNYTYCLVMADITIHTALLWLT